MTKTKFAKFSWKRFLTVTIAFIVVSFVVKTIWNYFDDDKQVSEVFTSGNIIKQLVVGTVFGLVFAFLTVERVNESRD